jgi:hypothetical protein
LSACPQIEKGLSIESFIIHYFSFSVSQSPSISNQQSSVILPAPSNAPQLLKALLLTPASSPFLNSPPSRQSVFRYFEVFFLLASELNTHVPPPVP